MTQYSSVITHEPMIRPKVTTEDQIHAILKWIRFQHAQYSRTTRRPTLNFAELVKVTDRVKNLGINAEACTESRIVSFD